MKNQTDLVERTLRHTWQFVFNLQTEHWTTDRYDKHELTEELYDTFRTVLDEPGEHLVYLKGGVSDPTQVLGHKVQTAVGYDLRGFAADTADSLAHGMRGLELDPATEDLLVEVLREYEHAEYLLAQFFTDAS